MTRVYLDHNATAPLHPAAREALSTALERPGNASSVHGEGRAVRAMVETAREAVARLCGAPPANLVFTSGGSESNAMVLEGLKAAGWTLLCSAVEHPSVLAHVAEEDRVAVTADGLLDLAALDAALERAARDGLRPLLSLMAANNETGVLQPLEAAAARMQAAGGLLHVDAVQAPGRLDMAPIAKAADYLTLSAHKLGGLPGCGALAITGSGVPVPPPLITGGGQERGRRAGTENAPAIATFGAMAAHAATEGPAEAARMATLRDRMEAEITAACPDVRMAGQAAPRLPNTSSLICPRIPGDQQVIRLDLAGFAVSAGSACSSGRVTTSHVLLAMGLPEEDARAAIRVSLGPATTDAEIDRFITAYLDMLGR